MYASVTMVSAQPSTPQTVGVEGNVGSKQEQFRRGAVSTFRQYRPRERGRLINLIEKRKCQSRAREVCSCRGIYQTWGATDRGVPPTGRV